MSGLRIRRLNRGDLPQVLVHLRLVSCQRVEDRPGFPDEDARVPIEASRGEVVGGRVGVGFLAELYDVVRPVARRFVL